MNESRQTSLDNLAHIANMSHELLVLNEQIKSDSAPGSTPSLRTLFSQTKQTAKPAQLPLQLPDGSQTSAQGQEHGDGKKAPVRSKKMACVDCRQQKSRCDASERYPLPCTRCTNKGLKCDLKSDYKRTYKRARIAQIEREFEMLKSSLSTAQAQGLLPALSLPAGLAPVMQKLLLQHPQHPQLQAQIQQMQQMHQHQMLRSQTGHSSDSQAGQLPYTSEWVNSPLGLHVLHNSSDINSLPNTPSILKVDTPSASIPTLKHRMDGSAYSNTAYQPNGVGSGIAGGDPGSTTTSVETPVTFKLTEDILKCEEKTIGEVTLSEEMIKALYHEYVDLYHDILPVVDITRGPERIYRLCPALFWVMMFVSLRRFQDDVDNRLLIKLSPIVKDVLAEISISPITRYNPTEDDEPILNASSVFSVQAFLLYTFWPPITSSLSADSSWNTIGGALYQAIRIGLHTGMSALSSTSTLPDQSQIHKAQENTRTWIICNVVSQTIATSFGFPAFVQFDSSAWAAFKPGSPIKIPKSIRFMMEIAHFEDQVAKTINSNTLDPFGLSNPTERLPLLKVLHRQLDDLEIRVSKFDLHTDNHYGLRKFQLLAARVHLLTYFFMDSSRISDFELQKGLVQVYNAAVALITHAQYCQAKDKKFVKYLPGVYILNIWQTSCIIGKLAHSPLKSIVDLGSGKEAYQYAISLAAKASILKHDMAYRSSGIMRNMWQLFRTLDEKNMINFSITIRTRMSASLFFDCLFLLREQVGMIKLNVKKESSPEKIGGDGKPISDEDDDEEQEEEESNEEAIVSGDEEDGPDGSVLLGAAIGSSKSTPGSSASSKTRRQRSLSNTVNAESKARKIIRTIPLDPQPITAGQGKRLTIFNVVNHTPGLDNHSPDSKSPVVGKSDKSAKVPQNYPNQQHQQQHNIHNHPQQHIQHHPHGQLSHQVHGGFPNFRQNPVMIQRSSPHNSHFVNAQQGQAPEFSLNGDLVLNESPVQGELEGLELSGLDIPSDLLWKDVDSVMNDFGFHT